MFVIPSWWYWVIKSRFVWRPEWKTCDRFGRMSWWKRRWKRTRILRQTRFLAQDRIPSTCHKSCLSINILIKNIKSFGPQLNKMYLWIHKVISSSVHNQVLHISWSIAIKHLRILAGLAEALELRRRKIFHKLQIFFNVHLPLQTNRQDVKFVPLKIFHNIGFAANW